jgi:hypothetical protein
MDEFRRQSLYAQIVWSTPKEFDTIARIGYKAFDYVIRRLNALLIWDKGWLKGLTFAETPFSAISRFNWSPEPPEARLLLKALVKMVPRSSRIWSSQPR